MRRWVGGIIIGKWVGGIIIGREVRGVIRRGLVVLLEGVDI
ncbi:16106_t:CDS:1, partial [Dentiscutata erythropus]